ncbi:hypothetical protein AAFF_G00354720 [Aldrovandia affinis]|uniref:Peptidase A2 domain-containing protein n=1 Tax=Aldrovandia affinis TaxID=143900 RepID=A0AAD7SJ11_9TELE|nr:hypothetical protein AAFF_G00354720 [Aldrovandia affinis]
MELDTGSAVSIIPATTYEKHFKNKKLRKTDVVLRTYSREKLSPKGMLQVHVKYGEKTQELPLYVVNGNGPPLLGRDWLTHMKLNWSEIKLLRTTKTTETETHKRLEQLLKKHEAVFQDQMGTPVSSMVQCQAASGLYLSCAVRHRSEKIPPTIQLWQIRRPRGTAHGGYCEHVACIAYRPSDRELRSSTGGRQRQRDTDLWHGWQFTWNFVMAKVAKPLLGADFLCTNGLLVDVKNHRLVDAEDFGSFPCTLSGLPTMTLSCVLMASGEFSHLLGKFPDLTRPTFSNLDAANLRMAEFGFVRHDAHWSLLQPPHDGPFHVLEPGDKTFVVDIGGKPDHVSVDRLKPAHHDCAHPRRGHPPTAKQDFPLGAWRSHLLLPRLPGTGSVVRSGP